MTGADARGHGQTLHSLLWTPYFSWKYGHHRHHSNHASLERDEVYVPRTRADLGIPPPRASGEAGAGHKEGEIDWDEYFGDTPAYTLFELVRQQLFAFEAYLRKFALMVCEICGMVLMRCVVWNVSGQKHYPKWTNHFDRTSPPIRTHTVD